MDLNQKSLTEYNEDNNLLISGIQHFCFCRRQWALIHVEQQWRENYLTAEGRIEHKQCHDESQIEKRKNLLVVRGMRVVSRTLKLSGVCDVVEFYADAEGININYCNGLWKPMPVEYKHGHSKSMDADRIQLCAEAMALEEMLVCDIQQGALFYEETKRREIVEFTQELREKTKTIADEMQQYFKRGYTPKVKTGSFCKSCSLNGICLPKLCGRLDAEAYIDNALGVSS